MGQIISALMVHVFLIVITARHARILQKENAILQQAIKNMMPTQNVKVTVDTIILIAINAIMEIIAQELSMMGRFHAMIAQLHAIVAANQVLVIAMILTALQAAALMNAVRILNAQAGINAKITNVSKLFHAEMAPAAMEKTAQKTA